MRRLPAVATAVVVVAAVMGVAGPIGPAPSQAAPPAFGTTTVFARVPLPGYPAYVLVHRNGRVYAGTYQDSQQASMPSRVYEWTASGTLLRSWPVPGQTLDGSQGIQVADQTHDGRLVVLDAQGRVLTLDPRTGRWRLVARIAGTPNYASWGPGGDLYVTDDGGAAIWRIDHRTHRATEWFTDPALQGVGFGTTGIAYRPAHHDFLIGQQTTLSGATLPTDGGLYTLPLLRSGRPGTLTPFWTSQPADLPDGFGIARSGHVYVALSGLANQIVEVSAKGTEIRRIGTRLSGANGSPIPFSTPCSATFLGRSIMVANQAVLTGEASQMAVLRVHVGERGVAPYLPRDATL